MSFSNYLETELLDHVFAGNAYTSPSSVYVGLFTSSPTDADSGTEVSGGSYVRKVGSFTVSGNTATTSGAIEWPTATASWGTITHIGIYDASSAGNLLYHGALSASKSVETNDTFIVEAGDLSVSLD